MERTFVLQVASTNARDDQSAANPITKIQAIPSGSPEPHRVDGRNNTPIPTEEHNYETAQNRHRVRDPVNDNSVIRDREWTYDIEHSECEWDLRFIPIG